MTDLNFIGPDVAGTYNAGTDRVEITVASRWRDLSPQANGLGAITGAVPLSLAGLPDGASVFYGAQLAGNTTISVTNPVRQVGIRLRIVQAATGGPFTLAFGGTVRWGGAAPSPVLTATAAGIDYFLVLVSPGATSLEVWKMQGPMA